MEQTFKPVKNLDDAAIITLVKASRDSTLRTITDYRNGDKWYWPAELATHSEGAAMLGVPYDLPPGAGAIITLD